MATSSEATHDSSTDPDLRAELVVGVPVGGPTGITTCDGCANRLTDGNRAGEPNSAEADAVFAHVRALDADRWHLRRITCGACGPDRDPGECPPGELVVTGTLTFDPRLGERGALALADVEHYAGGTQAGENR